MQQRAAWDGVISMLGRGEGSGAYRIGPPHSSAPRRTSLSHGAAPSVALCTAHGPPGRVQKAVRVSQFPPSSDRRPFCLSLSLPLGYVSTPTLPLCKLLRPLSSLAMCVARRWCATSRYASVAHELVSFVSLDAGASSPLHTRLFIHRRSQYVSEHRSRYVVPSSSSSRLCRYVSQGLHRVGRRRVRVHARKGGKQSIRECVHPPSSSDSFYRASECARADRPRYVLPDRIGFARPARSRTVVPKPCRAGPRPRTRASALLRCRTARGRVAGRALLVAGSLHAGSQRRRGSARGAGRRARVDARAGRCVQKSRRGACERI